MYSVGCTASTAGSRVTAPTRQQPGRGWIEVAGLPALRIVHTALARVSNSSKESGKSRRILPLRPPHHSDFWKVAVRKALSASVSVAKGCRGGSHGAAWSRQGGAEAQAAHGAASSAVPGLGGAAGASGDHSDTKGNLCRASLRRNRGIEASVPCGRSTGRRASGDPLAVGEVSASQPRGRGVLAGSAGVRWSRRRLFHGLLPAGCVRSTCSW